MPPIKIDNEQIRNLQEQLLSNGNLLKISLSGTSMRPIFHQGDEAIIIKISHEKLKLGDIIVFKQSSNYVAHRYLKKISINNILYLYSKGDSCKTFDQPIAIDQLIGKIISIQRNGKEFHLNSLKFNILNRILANFSNYTHYLNSPKISHITKFLFQ